MVFDSSPVKIHCGPAAPDGSIPSPIDNTFSSPGDNTRRKCGRRSLATSTPVARSNRRLNISDTTPTPSITRSHRGGRRRALSTTPAVATPSYTDDALPSSEGGEGNDANEITTMYFWRQLGQWKLPFTHRATHGKVG